DLGTSFVVVAYPEDDAVRVAVTSGKVALRSDVSNSGPGVALTTGQLGTVDLRGLVSVQSAADLSPFTAWTKGRLVFQGARAEDVATELGRWFDINIELANALADAPVTFIIEGES